MDGGVDFDPVMGKLQKVDRKIPRHVTVIMVPPRISHVTYSSR